MVGPTATAIERLWLPLSPLTWQEYVWLLGTQTDDEGRSIIEDYPPWMTVDEVHKGQIEVQHMSPGICAIILQS